MPELEFPSCTLDVRDPSRCSNIAMAKPAQAIRVLIRPEDEATTKLMEAGVPSPTTGSRSLSWSHERITHS